MFQASDNALDSLATTAGLARREGESDRQLRWRVRTVLRGYFRGTSSYQRVCLLLVKLGVRSAWVMLPISIDLSET